MSDSTLRLKAISELQALDAWISKVRQARLEVQQLAQAMQQIGGVTGGGTTSAGQNSVSGSPPSPPPSSQGAQSTPPAAAPSTATAASGAPPAAAPATAAQIPAGFAMTRFQTNKQGQIVQAWYTNGAGAGQPPKAQDEEGSGGRMVSRAAGFARHTFGTAIGVALGGSIQGFLMESAHTYMRVSQAVAQLEARFRSAGQGAAFFATQLGYTSQQGAQLAGIYGGALNSFDPHRARTFVGAARTTGMDAAQAMGLFGGIFQTRPSSIDDNTRIARLIGNARIAGMGEGRLPEYLQTFAAAQDLMLNRGMRAGDQNVAQMLSLPGQVFAPGDERGRGSRALGFLQGLDQMGQAQPMRSFLLRQMRFGTKDGPSYRQAMVALDQGLLDPGNLQLMTKGFDRMGIGGNADAIFRALQPFKGSMSADALSRMSDLLADPTRRGAFFAGFGGRGTSGADQAFLHGLSDQDRELFAKAGFAGVGATKVSQGEAMAVRLEAMQLQMGKTVAQTIDDMRGIAMDLIKSFKNLIGDDFGTQIHNGLMGLKQATDAIVELTTAINHTTGGGLSALPHGVGATAAVGAKLGADEGVRYWFANAPESARAPILWNIAISAARSGTKGAYMQALGAWVRGQGEFPTTSPYNESVMGSEGP
jgi:hypothetical protein